MAISAARAGRVLSRRLLLPTVAIVAALTLGLSVCSIDPVRAWADQPASGNGAHFYSTAAPPRDYGGPVPVLLARADAPTTKPDAEPKAPADEDPSLNEPALSDGEAGETVEDIPAIEESPETTRIASTDADSLPHARPAEESSTEAEPKEIPFDPIEYAKQTVRVAKAQYEKLEDYTCTFYKRELVGRRMTSQHVMQMKAKTRPLSVYFKFVQPNSGREAIYVQGRNGGKALVHDVGLGKLIAGTLALDPRSSRAMEDNRHPITEAGIGHMIDELHQRWDAEMKHGETQVRVVPGTRVGSRTCTMIESKHPQRHPNYLFHMVRVYFDQEHGLPIRFEAYNWPTRPGAKPQLAEEYTYVNLKVNVGLRDLDFDPSNTQYSFGRF